MLWVIIIIGVLLDLLIFLQWGWTYNSNLVLYLISFILILAMLFGDRITKSLKENINVRIIVIIILIGIILVPLVFLGTCLLSFGRL